MPAGGGAKKQAASRQTLANINQQRLGISHLAPVRLLAFLVDHTEAIACNGRRATSHAPRHRQGALRVRTCAAGAWVAYA